MLLSPSDKDRSYGYAASVLSPDQVETETTRLLKELKIAYASARNSLVSCWHASDVESEALWQIYCPVNMPGLAVRTTAAQLWKAISAESDAVVGRVHYLDFRRSYAPSNKRLFCKRSSLAHGREVRAVIPDRRGSDDAGKLIACDIGGLINGAVISPFAPSWFSGVVERLIKVHGYSIGVERSGNFCCTLLLTARCEP